MDVRYRVVIFASARISEGGKEHQDVYSIAQGLADLNFNVVTDGDPGIMQAANTRHKSASNGTHAMGIKIRLPFEQESNTDQIIGFDKYSARLDTLLLFPML